MFLYLIVYIFDMVAFSPWQKSTNPSPPFLQNRDCFLSPDDFSLLDYAGAILMLFKNLRASGLNNDCYY